LGTVIDIVTLSEAIDTAMEKTCVGRADCLFYSEKSGNVCPILGTCI